MQCWRGGQGCGPVARSHRSAAGLGGWGLSPRIRCHSLPPPSPRCSAPETEDLHRRIPNPLSFLFGRVPSLSLRPFDMQLMQRLDGVQSTSCPPPPTHTPAPNRLPHFGPYPGAPSGRLPSQWRTREMTKAVIHFLHCFLNVWHL